MATLLHLSRVLYEIVYTFIQTLGATIARAILCLVRSYCVEEYIHNTCCATLEHLQAHMYSIYVCLPFNILVNLNAAYLGIHRQIA